MGNALLSWLYFVAQRTEHPKLVSILASQPKAGKGGTCPVFGVVMFLLYDSNLWREAKGGI